VYLIGGGALARRVPRWARAAGLAPLVADRDPDAPGFEEAAERVVLDGRDAEGHAAAARGLAACYDIGGVYCGGEHGLASARRVAEELDLPHPSAQAIERSLDKLRAKEAFRAAGVATPAGCEVRAAGDLAALLAKGPASWVVKPAGGSGSRGVRVVVRGDNLDQALAASRAGAPGALVAEPFLAGRSIDANGCFLDGSYVPCGTLEKFETPLPERLPIGGEDPARLTPAEERAVHALVEAGARALGVDQGPVKGDLILTAEGPWLLEVAPRFHGDVTSANTLPFGSGLSPYELWFRWLARGVRDARSTERALGHGAWRVLALPPGRVLRLPPPPRRLSRGITCVWHNPRAAERIAPYCDTTAIPGYLCAAGSDRGAAEQALADYLASAGYAVEADPAQAEWHRRLAGAYRAAGLDPHSAGFGCERAVG
jgi:biotin carboxylase